MTHRDPPAIPEGGQPVPIAFLVEGTGDSRATYALFARTSVVGRGNGCDVMVPQDRPGVSRQHARLLWIGGEFHIEDLGTPNGTRVNDRRVESTRPVALRSGDALVLGDWAVQFVLAGASTGREAAYGHVLSLLSRLSSLRLEEVVARALDLLKLASGAERAFIVCAGTQPRLDPLLTPLESPYLEVSRSAIQEALRTGATVRRHVEEDGAGLSESMELLSLRRVWVSPIKDGRGGTLASVYLDSKKEGPLLDHETERLMEALVQQIGIAMRNALLHDEIVSLNEHLEDKVAQRTRQLEESRALLIAQDRLATLGRLVAAIAHEMNNPAGAIASLAGTVEELRESVLAMKDRIRGAFTETAEADAAMRLVRAALHAAERTPSDTRTRRALEARLATFLQSERVPSAETLARRLARAELAEQEVALALAPLRRDGPTLTVLVEQAHTFASGVRTIGSSATHLARIVNGLKSYAHLDQSSLEEADIHHSIQTTLEVLAPRIPHGVEVETRFAQIPPFPHRPGELVQVWTNLIDNALHAMGESGHLTIETLERGDEVVVTVTDTGCGVPEAMRDRLFDLDATTRGPGAGLGLGLPICRSIIEKNHGGSISFESRPGQTAMTVKLRTVAQRERIPGRP